jgi:hypothetical protein
MDHEEEIGTDETDEEETPEVEVDSSPEVEPEAEKPRIWMNTCDCGLTTNAWEAPKSYVCSGCGETVKVTSRSTRKKSGGK